MSDVIICPTLGIKIQEKSENKIYSTKTYPHLSILSKVGGYHGSGKVKLSRHRLLSNLPTTTPKMCENCFPLDDYELPW